MTQWGRNPASEDGEQTSRRFGARSVQVGIAAFVLALVVLGVWMVFPADYDRNIDSLASVAFLSVFLSIIPLINLVGAFFGIRALFRSDDSKGLGVLGLFLNLTFPGVAIGFTYFLIRTGVAEIPAAVAT